MLLLRGVACGVPNMAGGNGLRNGLARCLGEENAKSGSGGCPFVDAWSATRGARCGVDAWRAWPRRPCM